MTALLHPLRPLLILAAVGIDHHVSFHQRAELGCLKVAAAAGGKPKILRIMASADEGCLLALHKADDLLGIAWHEMQAEQHLLRIFQLRTALRLHANRPHGIAPSLHAMTVFVVRHELRIVHTLPFVYHPEYDRLATVPSFGYDVLLGRAYVILMKHLPLYLFVEWKLHEPSAEGALAPRGSFCPSQREELCLDVFGSRIAQLPAHLRHVSHFKFGGILRSQFRMIAEELSRRIMIAAAVGMVADAAEFGELLSGLLVHVSAEGFPSVAIWTGVFPSSPWEVETVGDVGIVHRDDYGGAVPSPHLHKGSDPFVQFFGVIASCTSRSWCKAPSVQSRL